MKRLIYSLLLVCAMILYAPLSGSARESYNISRDWKFFTHSESQSQIVNLPHQWNLDALSGRTDYFRGNGHYMRYIDAKPEWKNKRVFIRFGGANLVADLLINGRYVGRHKGGSEAFVMEIGDYLQYNGRDLVWVVVNNATNLDVMPTAGNHIKYGGLYREAEIIVQEPSHIALGHYGSQGVYVHTKKVSAEKVEGEVEVKVSSDAVVSAMVHLKVLSPTGGEVLSTVQRMRTINGTTGTFLPFEIENPELWNGTEGAALYKFEVSLAVNGSTKDNVTVSSGFRHYMVNANGFTLNGKPYPIRGVLLHRDRPLSGTAVSEQEVLEDISIAVEMGANAIRVVGGSYHPSFYTTCDRLGLLVINDLPLIGSTTLNGKGFFNTEAFKENGKEQLSEMIYQHYNNPSVVVWNLFSELELRGENPVGYVRELHSLAKRLDPNRFTCGWSNQDGEINFITDLIVWSHSYGWSEGLPTDITVWQEQLHATPEWSALRSGVSYKCGGSIFHQSDLLDKPLSTGAWHPERWQTHFHETYWDALREDSLFWGLFVDTLFDYVATGTSRSSGGVSDMGVVSFNRQVRKDAFFLYKAAWNEEDEFIHLAEKRWSRRTNTTQQIKVYTNLPDVDLTVNGKFMGSLENTTGVVVWPNVELQRGTNLIEVSSRGLTDQTYIEIPYNTTSDL
ncbi:MAG: glycoside hydrolase family 2 protein [Tidjanibacter sp.]|nr:glycoside hydrolase family 2 protein [Tidjanibacter sp.]